jgi:hypothetical protein
MKRLAEEAIPVLVVTGPVRRQGSESSSREVTPTLSRDPIGFLYGDRGPLPISCRIKSSNRSSCSLAKLFSA